MSAHTPGPWAVLPLEEDAGYIRIRGTRLGMRYKIADVIVPVYLDTLGDEWTETKANARLIAASPDLLAALRSVMAWAHQIAGDNCDALAAKRESESAALALAAITKAIGESA